MPQAYTVLIGAANLLPTLKDQTADLNGEVLAFSDAEAIRALEAIVKRRPRTVALERMFSTTPRGVALINRIKSDPALTDLEIRVLTHDPEYRRLIPEPPPPPMPIVPAEPSPAPVPDIPAPVAVAHARRRSDCRCGEGPQQQDEEKDRAQGLVEARSKEREHARVHGGYDAAPADRRVRRRLP